MRLQPAAGRFRPFISCLLLASVLPAEGQWDRESAADSIRYRMSEVTVTANRYEKTAFETHLPVQTLSDDDLWDAGISQPADAASLAAGAASAGTGPWSRRWTLRGLSGPRVLVLVNGLRLDVMRSMGEHPPLMDADQIRKIEIIRGPASVLYGSDAVAGVVNYVTEPLEERTAGRIPLSGSIGGQYSSVDRQWNETARLRWDGRRGHASGFLCRRTTEDIRTPGGVLPNTGFGGWTGQAETGWRFTPDARISFTGQADRMNPVGVPTDPYAASARFTAYDRNRITASFRADSPRRAPAAVRIDAYGQEEFRDFDAFISRKPKGPLFVDQSLNARRRVKAAGFSGQAVFAVGKTVGIAGADGFILDVRSERSADSRLFDAAGNVVKDPPADHAPPLPRAGQTGFGIFGSWEAALASWATVQTGLRFDRIGNRALGTAGTLVTADRFERDLSLSGNAGVIFRLGGGFRITANAGRAFRAPALEERYFRGPGQAGFVTGNPSLLSETGWNLDLGLKWKTERLEGELSAFRNRVDDLIVLQSVNAAKDTLRYVNVGRALLRGAEFRAAASVTDGLSIGGYASCVFAEDIRTGEFLPRIPPVSGTLAVRAHGIRGAGRRGAADRWHLEMDWRMTAAQNRTGRNESATSGYGLLDLSFGIGFSNRASAGLPAALSVSVRNVFNRRYRDHLSMVYWQDAPGRDVVVGLKVTI